MFFIMGVAQGRKNFDYNQMVVCGHCGSYGRYQVYITYTRTETICAGVVNTFLAAVHCSSVWAEFTCTMICFTF